MRESGKQRLCGQFSRSIIRRRDTSMICSTGGRLYLENCTNFVSRWVNFLLWKPEIFVLFYLSWAKLIIDLQEKIADGNLIAKWKKQGYENLCCLRCIQTRDTNFATNCICRWKFLLLIQYRTSICAVAGCPRGNWRRERSWSVFTVAAEDVLDKSKSHWKFLIK